MFEQAFKNIDDVLRQEAGCTTELAYIDDAQAKQLDNVVVEVGDVLLNITGASIARCCVVPDDVLPTRVNQHMTILRTESQQLLSRFLQYMLVSKDYKHRLLTAGEAGATRQALTKGLIEAFGVNFPEVPEQERIVAIFDEAFAAIAMATANTEKNLANARELFESHLNAVFNQKGDGWVEKKLGDVFTVGSSKRIYKTHWTPSGVPFYGGKEIVKLAGYGTAESAAYISEEKYQEYASKYEMPQRDDILMTARGTIGIGYIVQDGDRFYYKDGNVILLRMKMPTNPRFILYAFKSEQIMSQITSLTGATVIHLSIQKANELVINLPGFDLQNSIVSEMATIENETQRLASIYQRKLTSLAELKQSILHKAFTGELTADFKSVDRELSEAGV